MKTFLFTIVVVSQLQLFAQQKKTQVMILGSYHMANPGLDVFNMQADDVGSSKRQKEIEEFVELITAFKPTKICLEYPTEKQSKLQENYQSYLDGKYELRKNESDQVGFRLAKKMKLNQVYAIDSKAPFAIDTVIKTAQYFKITSFLEGLAKMPELIKEQSKKLQESTITQFYQYLNNDESVRQSHEMYLKMVAVGKDNNFAGADLVADWYKRNLRIFRNLLLLSPTTDDRILIIFGSGHTKILQDLVEDSADMKLIKLSNLQ